MHLAGMLQRPDHVRFEPRLDEIPTVTSDIVLRSFVYYSKNLPCKVRSDHAGGHATMGKPGVVRKPAGRQVPKSTFTAGMSDPLSQRLECSEKPCLP